MKLNEDKCHLMILGAKRSNETTITIGEASVKESTEENLLAITFDQSLSFKQHVKALCTKPSQKMHALARISRYMDTEKLQWLMTAFILSHTVPLVWMFYDRALNHRKIIFMKGHYAFHTKITTTILVFSWSNLNRCQSM